MSTAVAKNFQVGSDSTATNNFTIRQPATPDGTVRIANGNSGTTTDLVTVTSAGNVGVGTTSPGAKLDVSGDVIGRATTLRFKDSGNTTQYGAIYADSTTFNVNAGVNNLLLYSAGTERMRLDSSGNLGLGVTPSAWRTDVSFKALQMPGGSFTAYMAGGLDQTPGIAANGYIDAGGTWRYINSRAASWYIQNGGMHIWYNAASGTAGNAISFTQAMTLDASGNLGIGTTSPGTKLDVVGVITSRSDSFAAIRFKNAAGTDKAFLSYEDGSTAIYLNNYGSGPIVFKTADTERARITSGGYLLVGTTSTNPSSGGLAFGDTSALGGAGWGVITSATSTSGSYVGYFKNPNGAVGSIIVSGTTTSYNTVSDYRLKENIQPMAGALAKVAALKPCIYTWKADGADGEGFIAHELAEVCPQAVTGEKDAVDADGTPKYQGIDTSFLVATLTAAIQELKAELDSVKTELALLKGTA